MSAIGRLDLDVVDQDIIDCLADQTELSHLVTAILGGDSRVNGNGAVWLELDYRGHGRWLSNQQVDDLMSNLYAQN